MTSDPDVHAWEGHLVASLASDKRMSAAAEFGASKAFIKDGMALARGPTKAL
jgi:hypothetical protein